MRICSQRLANCSPSLKSSQRRLKLSGLRPYTTVLPYRQSSRSKVRKGTVKDSGALGLPEHVRVMVTPCGFGVSNSVVDVANGYTCCTTAISTARSSTPPSPKTIHWLSNRVAFRSMSRGAGLTYYRIDPAGYQEVAQRYRFDHDERDYMVEVLDTLLHSSARRQQPSLPRKISGPSATVKGIEIRCRHGRGLLPVLKGNTSRHASGYPSPKIITSRLIHAVSAIGALSNRSPHRTLSQLP